MDNLIQSIVELADGAQELAREAERQYLAEVEDILKAQSRDSRRIERCLDGMLDSCFDNGMLVLFKKFCHYYTSLLTRKQRLHTYRPEICGTNRPRGRKRGDLRRKANASGAGQRPDKHGMPAHRMGRL